MKTAAAAESFTLSRRARGLSEHTIRWYRGILSKFGKQYASLPYKPEDIERFLASLSVGDERRHGYYRALRAFYHFAHRRYGAKDPMAAVEAPKVTAKKPKYLSY